VNNGLSIMKPRVLVAEDNIDHLELLSDALSEENDVIGTDSREGCMDLLEKKRFDLVVLDYNLKKDFSGFDILREITLKYPYLPVIMVTAYGNEELAVKVMKIGAKDYIRKTLDNNYIDRIVRNVRTLVQKKEKGDYKKVKQNALHFLRQKEKEFIGLWKEKIHTKEEKFDVSHNLELSDRLLSQCYRAFINDLEKDQLNETLTIFKKTIEQREKKERILLGFEILNITFKEIAHGMLIKEFSNFFDFGSTLMDQINWIIDVNEIVLNKEYEKIIDDVVEEVKEQEHFSARADLIESMKEQLSESLRAIEKTSMVIAKDEGNAAEKSFSEILAQVKKIESIITTFEDDCHKHLKEYRNKKIKEINGG
jgi:DNA-binding response OmpR family regulator